MSLRESIINADDIESEVITVKQWNNVRLEIRGMTARLRARVANASADGHGGADLEVLYPSLVVNTVFDPDTGEKVFTDADMPSISDRAASAIEQIADVAMRLSGLTPEAVEEAGKDSSSTVNTASSMS